MMLMKNPNFGGDLGMTVQIRTRGRYQYSYIESAAVQIGDDVLEVSSFGDVFFNGVSSAKVDGAKLADKYAVTHSQEGQKHVYSIKTDEHEQIVITTFKDIVGIYAHNPSVANFGAAVGLLGNFTTGLKLGRDGETVVDDPVAFGQEWQIRPESEPVLFQTRRQPQYPERCLIPSIKSEVRRLGEAFVTQEQAEEACDHWKDAVRKSFCVMDVLAMQDLDLSQAAGAL